MTPCSQITFFALMNKLLPLWFPQMNIRSGLLWEKKRISEVKSEECLWEQGLNVKRNKQNTDTKKQLINNMLF